MFKWNQQVNTNCMLCHEPMETRHHLFFGCSYSQKVWEKLIRGILLDKYSTYWREVFKTICDKNYDKTKIFILRYVFQNTVHSIWGERNA
ncbi:putative reverse transcriptase zinc-binding domain-containing protein [Arabidopsis thaliana]